VQAGWVVSRDDHGLLLGAPGSRKSTTVILPTLATIAEAGLSVLVTDPKGELYAAAGGRFQAAGYRVAVLDLRDPAQSARWNPLTPVAAQLAAGRRTDAARTARALAQVLAADGAPAGDAGRFWEQSTTALITALALLVADQAPADQRHLASVYATLIHTANLDAVFAALPPDHPAVQAYGPVKLSGAETRQNQLTVAATTLQLFGDPSVAWLTAADELAVADLAAPGCAVFVVVPDESSAYYGLAALFVQQALAALAEAAAQAPGQRLPRPVHLVLDEFGNLPRLPDFDKALAVARGKGVRITIALQALAQLTARYGPDLGKVMQNSCNTWVYLAGNDWETAETVSRKTGQSTVQTTSRHRLAQGGDQETVAGTGRALLTPDEVLRWPLGTALVLQAGHLPARLPLRRYDAWPGPWDAAPPRTARAVTVPPIWRPDAAAPPPDAYRVVRL
jgi:type IV secretion system protein VirD4